jgi:hypothetical protein
LGVAILIAPARAEVGRARIAEGYAERVVGAGLLELPPSMVAPVRAGRRVGEVGPFDVAIALPGALLARLGASEGVDATVRRALGGAMLSWVLFASVGAVFFARLRRERGQDLPTEIAIGGTAALLVATSLLQGARRGDATLLATLALLLLLDELDAPPLVRRRRHAVQLSVLGFALALAHPAFVASALALAVLDAGRREPPGRRWRLALATGAPILLAAALGRWWDMRAALPTPSSGAPFHALFGLVLSTGRGLFVYSPLALLGVYAFPRLWARTRARAEAIAVVVCTALPSIALRADWHGDPAFGPPLLIPLLPLFIEPAVLLLLARRCERLSFATFAAVGIIVQLLGLAVQVETWPRVIAEVRAATGAPGWFLDPSADVEFVPQLSPLVGQWTLTKMALGRPLPSEPPFSLVVGSDQAETAIPPAAHAAWAVVRAKIDRNALRPSLAIEAAGPALRRAQLLGALLALVIGAWSLRRCGEEEVRWRRG